MRATTCPYKRARTCWNTRCTLGSAPVAGGAELIEVRENGQKVARVDPSREPVFRRRRAEIASESPLVARLQRPHATWQWAQLIAETTWQAAQADAFFSPRITRDAPDRLVGEITARDLYRCFHNDWVARAHIECGARRDLLARLFAAQPALSAATAGLVRVGSRGTDARRRA